MRIYINQAGYLPKSVKTVILAEEVKNPVSSESLPDKRVRIFDQNGEKCILEKKAEYFGLDIDSEDLIWRADFSELTEEGYYQIRDEEGGKIPFRIFDNIYDILNQILRKALFFQRCGMELKEQHAGIFKRKSCHEDRAVLLEDYDRLSTENDGKVRWFDVRGGWHDAGDYGRYTTAAAAALAHILYAFQLFPESFSASLYIPESDNQIPDILNECLYELRWLLKMQMEDGSVCHKLTSMRHANFVMPHEDKRQMILFPASTMATADFAAIMALAFRVYRKYDETFAKEALKASQKAWAWMEDHPEFIGFQNPEGCNTGDYADDNDRDERLWAVSELYYAIGDKKYLDLVEKLVKEIADLTAMGWSDVAGFAGWSFLQEQMALKKEKSCDNKCRDKSESEMLSLQNQFREAFLGTAENILKISQQSGYFAALETDDYGWGSNMVMLNRAMILGTAYLLEPKEDYLNAVIRQMDYLLGVNATGYSYVTEVGKNAFRNPHNRVTVADGIEKTIPGFVSGGANSHPVDEKAEWLIEPGTPPMKCFLDVWECYSLNEITIYWNSPAIFVAAFLDSVYNTVRQEKTIPFETLASEKIQVGRFTVVEDQVKVNGHQQPYDYLEIREGVSILPIKDGKVIVQRQYRYPVRSWQWEIPGGFVDEGETPQEAAIRELKEETGYAVKEICSMGAFYPSFGSTNEKIHLFFAECGELGASEREPGEMIYVEEIPLEKIGEMVASGEFMHGAGLATWARYRQMNLLL